jgi:hypothetical protein
MPFRGPAFTAHGLYGPSFNTKIKLKKSFKQKGKKKKAALLSKSRDPFS